jgi:formate hydrogenlyase subunit 3/multisubunit Na+/H+ antiporter MnhD subunit
MVVFFIIGSVFAILPGRKDQYYLVSLLSAGTGSCIVLVAGIIFLFFPMHAGKEIIRCVQPIGVLPIDRFPGISISMYADRLSALFLILTGGLSLAATLHMSACLENARDCNRISAAYNLFILSIVLTLLANNVYFFLFSLECITVTYAYLVLYRHNRMIDRAEVSEESVDAAKTAFKSYLIFEHVACMLLMVALVLISIQSTGLASFDFDTFRLAAHQVDPIDKTTSSLIFLLALGGFGIKAGMFPTHIWVPLVHPFSPTSIHAMMSGIVLEAAGLYGMYRFFFEFTKSGEVWWGLLVLLLAGASALVGVFYATIGKDLKTALASHSVEHIGIILAGIGLAMIYRWAADLVSPSSTLAKTAALVPYQSVLTAVSSSFRMAEVLALIASLYHLVNHSIFKSLLFFATGAIENRTGTTSLDRLGGLIKRYPWTAATFLVGAVSIAGMPPFNGFVSEWLIMQTLFSGMNLFLPEIKSRMFILVVLVITLLCLALAFGITALAFVKIAGEVLLGMPRDSEVARRSRPGEVSWRIRGVLAALASLCLLMGLLPGYTAGGLSYIVGDFITVRTEELMKFEGPGLSIKMPVFKVKLVDDQKLIVANGSYQTRLSGRFLWGLTLIFAFPFVAYFGLRLLKRSEIPRLRRSPPWTGGGPYQPENMQYTGSAFSAQVWMAFEDDKIGAFFKREKQEEADTHVFVTTEQMTGRRAVGS